jgi:hypothetical protein
MRMSFGLADQTERCASQAFAAGRCELTAGHGGPHAVHRDDDVYFTWDLHRVSQWSGRKPPLWLFDMDWAGGLHPQVPAREA